MRRVVVTGMGIISSIGNDINEVTESLKTGRSGIVAAPDYTEKGFRSQIHGLPKIDVTEHIDKRQMRFMGQGAAYNYLAMEQAITDSGLEDSDVSNERTGMVMGSGGPSTINLFNAHQITLEKGAPRHQPTHTHAHTHHTPLGPIVMYQVVMWKWLKTNCEPQVCVRDRHAHHNTQVCVRSR